MSATVRGRDPLSPHERRHLRLSAGWAAALLVLVVGYFLVLWLDSQLDFATTFGYRRHDVWVFLSELLPIPLFIGAMTCWGLSIAYSIGVVARRPLILIWLVGPPVGFAFLVLFFVVYFLMNSR